MRVNGLLRCEAEIGIEEDFFGLSLMLDPLIELHLLLGVVFWLGCHQLLYCNVIGTAAIVSGWANGLYILIVRINSTRAFQYDKQNPMGQIWDSGIWV